MFCERLWSMLGLAFACSFGVAACNGKQVKKDMGAIEFAKPGLEFRGIGFENQSFDGTDVTFKFALISQDPRPARGDGCTYSLELKDAEALQGKIDLKGELTDKTELPVQVTISLPWPEGREKVLAYLQRKRLPYRFHLNCKLQTPMGPDEVTNADAGSVPLPKLPQMDVIQANAERFGGSGEVRVNFELSMLNENPFRLSLDKIVYKVFLGETMVSEGDLPMAEVIPPSAEFTYDVATPIFNDREHKEILNMLSEAQVGYRLEGSIHLGRFVLPIKASGTINFPRAESD
jgi:LEA14-like dessication related protein